MNKSFLPTVSVIIPVYNAEKFLPVCLESLAIQTFTDFEVIVVDDCSTDLSVAVAESYLERFGERLKIFSLPQNTGSGAVPRNVGLENASGEYVCFVDADDLLVDNALEIFYNFAQEYRADVVYTEAGYICGKDPVPQAVFEDSWDPNLTVEEPTLEPDDFALRVKKFCLTSVRWPAWGKFLRRDLLIDNDIKFPPMRISEDGIWTFEVMCSAKKFLRVPTPLYIHRANLESVSQSDKSPADEIRFWMNPLLNGLEILDEFMNRFEFFERYPTWRLHVMNEFANASFFRMAPLFEKLEPGELYKIFTAEFKRASGNHAALFAYLLFISNRYLLDLKGKIS